MKNILIGLIILGSASTLLGQKPKPKNIQESMRKVADWQIEHFRDTFSGKDGPHHPLHWTNGALYIGMLKWAELSDEDKYYDWMKRIGEENEWNLHSRVYHADDHTVGQMYCDLYRKYNDPEMLAPMIKQFDYIVYHPAVSSLEWRTPFHQDRWNWCDALFMSPPVWAKLYNITGEEKYLDFLMKEFRATTDFLFDEEENLYYRDQNYMGKLDNGTKIFWARGNGWVFAGLVNVMSELDPASEEYHYFLHIYKKMASKLIAIQTPQGHWAMSLLGQEFYPTPETSGTAFYTYGLAWGINQGILDKATFEPVVRNGWNALVSYITDDGMLGYVQPIGAAPGNAWPDKTEVYGTGAFLSAGYEVYNLYAK